MEDRRINIQENNKTQEIISKIKYFVASYLLDPIMTFLGSNVKIVPLFISPISAWYVSRLMSIHE